MILHDDELNKKDHNLAIVFDRVNNPTEILQTFYDELLSRLSYQSLNKPKIYYQSELKEFIESKGQNSFSFKQIPLIYMSNIKNPLPTSPLFTDFDPRTSYLLNGAVGPLTPSDHTLKINLINDQFYLNVIGNYKKYNDNLKFSIPLEHRIAFNDQDLIAAYLPSILNFLKNRSIISPDIKFPSEKAKNKINKSQNIERTFVDMTSTYKIGEYLRSFMEEYENTHDCLFFTKLGLQMSKNFQPDQSRYTEISVNLDENMANLLNDVYKMFKPSARRLENGGFKTRTTVRVNFGKNHFTANMINSEGVKKCVVKDFDLFSNEYSDVPTIVLQIYSLIDSLFDGNDMIFYITEKFYDELGIPNFFKNIETAFSTGKFKQLTKNTKMVEKFETLRNKFQISETELEFHLTKEADPSSETTVKTTPISNQIQILLNESMNSVGVHFHNQNFKCGNFFDFIVGHNLPLEFCTLRNMQLLYLIHVLVTEKDSNFSGLPEKIEIYTYGRKDQTFKDPCIEVIKDEEENAFQFLKEKLESILKREIEIKIVNSNQKGTSPLLIRRMETQENDIIELNLSLHYGHTQVYKESNIKKGFTETLLNDYKSDVNKLIILKEGNVNSRFYWNNTKYSHGRYVSCFECDGTTLVEVDYEGTALKNKGKNLNELIKKKRSESEESGKKLKILWAFTSVNKNYFHYVAADDNELLTKFKQQNESLKYLKGFLYSRSKTTHFEIRKIEFSVIETRKMISESKF